MKTQLITTLLVASTLTACGKSQEEINNIATITCNVMGESRNMDAAFRIKEINEAREKIGAKPYLGGDEGIKRSFEYGLCQSLVRGDEDYELSLVSRINERRIAEEERRIAAEKAAEERRIAAEKAVEERRIAAEKAAELGRIARAEAFKKRLTVETRSKRLRNYQVLKEAHGDVIDALIQSTMSCDFPQKKSKLVEKSIDGSISPENFGIFVNGCKDSSCKDYCESFRVYDDVLN